MSIFDQDLILPGTITEILSDYASDYDTSLFGTTDSVLLVGTAFNGPVGKPVKIYSPEHARYVFGDTFDYSTRREATLVPEIYDCWEKGCRTIYAVRIGGKELYKDYEFATDTECKLRVSAIFPHNDNKEICFLYDSAKTALDKVMGKTPYIKIYKPANRATIEEKMLGHVPDSEAILVNFIDLGYSTDMTDSTRMVDFITYFNSNKYNNVVRLSIVDKNGRDITDSSEAQVIAFGDMFQGLYTIGRDANNSKVILKTEVSSKFIPQENREEIYETFSGDIFRTLEFNTDIRQPYPIYHKDAVSLNKLIDAVADVTMVTMFDFLEVPGKLNYIWLRDKNDYEEVQLDNYDFYERLGSGFANTAKIVETKEGSGVYKVIEVTDKLDKQRIRGIEDGILSVMENVAADYRAVTGKYADQDIKGKVPKKEKFLVSTPQHEDTWDGILRVTAKLDAKDLDAKINEYDFVLRVLADDSELLSKDDVITDTYHTTRADGTKDYPISKYAVLLTDKNKTNLDKVHLIEGQLFIQENSTDAGEYDIWKVTNGELMLLDDYSIYEELFTSYVFTDSGMFKLVKPAQGTSTSGFKVRLTKEDVPTVINNAKYVLVDVIGETLLFEVTLDAGKIKSVSAAASLKDVLTETHTIFSTIIQKVVADAKTPGHFKLIHVVNVKALSLESTLLNELLVEMNTDARLSELFTFTLAGIASSGYEYVMADAAAQNSTPIFTSPTGNTDVVNTAHSSIHGGTKGDLTLVDRLDPHYDLGLRIPYTTRDNFARQLAQHCVYTSLKTYPTHGVIGCSKMFSPGLQALDDRVELLIHKDYDLYAKKPNGNNMLDKDNTPYDIGRSISVIFTQHKVGTGDNYTYVTTGAAAYAGMISNLPIDQSSTAQPFSNNAPIFELTNYQLARLSQAGYVTIKNSYTKGYVVTDGITMAPYNSNFRRLSVTRIIGGVEEAIRNAADPFIGKQNHLANRNSLQAAIRSALDRMLNTLIERYDFAVATDRQAERMGIININYTIVPIYEIREVRNKITVSAE